MYTLLHTTFAPNGFDILSQVKTQEETETAALISAESNDYLADIITVFDANGNCIKTCAHEKH